MRLVRSRATEFGLSPERIGMLGFSAGGHLTVAVGTRYDGGDAGATDAVERVSSQPDFLVPVYAVTNGKKRGRKADEYTPADDRVSAETPHFWCTRMRTALCRRISQSCSIRRYISTVSTRRCMCLAMVNTVLDWPPAIPMLLYGKHC